MEFKHVPAPRSGITATGYGSRIPTGYMVRLESGQPWRRLYAVVSSNCPKFYVRVRGQRVTIRDADIPDTVA